MNGVSSPSNNIGKKQENFKSPNNLSKQKDYENENKQNDGDEEEDPNKNEEVESE